MYGLFRLWADKLPKIAAGSYYRYKLVIPLPNYVFSVFKMIKFDMEWFSIGILFNYSNAIHFIRAFAFSKDYPKNDTQWHRFCTHVIHALLFIIKLCLERVQVHHAPSSHRINKKNKSDVVHVAVKATTIPRPPPKQHWFIIFLSVTNPQ